MTPIILIALGLVIVGVGAGIAFYFDGFRRATKTITRFKQLAFTLGVVQAALGILLVLASLVYLLPMIIQAI